MVFNYAILIKSILSGAKVKRGEHINMLYVIYYDQTQFINCLFELFEFRRLFFNRFWYYRLEDLCKTNKVRKDFPIKGLFFDIQTEMSFFKTNDQIFITL